MRIGFAGLGSMGAPMALNLARAGHSVAAYNRTREKAEALRAEAPDRIRVAEGAADAASDAEVFVTMLADDAAVEAVVLGEEGVLAGLAGNAVHACASTISAGLARRLSQAHEAAGRSYVAAPVFGRPEAAAGARLWVVAAGRSADIERCRPVFEAVGQGTHVVGESPERANVVKLAGNFLIMAMLEGLAEAFALVRKSGMEADAFLALVNGSLFKSPIYDSYGGAIAREQWTPPGFKLRLGLKDARLALAAAEGLEAPLPLASLVHDRFLALVARGRGDLDWAALALASSEAAGL